MSAVQSISENEAQRKENLQRLQEFVNFEDNWNGYQAEKFQPTLIEKLAAALS